MLLELGQAEDRFADAVPEPVGASVGLLERRECIAVAPDRPTSATLEYHGVDARPPEPQRGDRAAESLPMTTAGTNSESRAHARRLPPTRPAPAAARSPPRRNCRRETRVVMAPSVAAIDKRAGDR